MEENKNIQALEREPPPSLNPKVSVILITKEEPAMPKETKHQKEERDKTHPNTKFYGSQSR